MTLSDRRKQLDIAVEDILKSHQPARFAVSWEMASATLGHLPVRGFYLNTDQGYANVAIMTDGLLVDVEGDDEGEGEPGNVSVRSLSAVTGVEFFGGPVKDIPESAEALLVMMVYIQGGETVDLHWIAYAEEERIQLLAFGNSVIDAVTRESR